MLYTSFNVLCMQLMCQTQLFDKKNLKPSIKRDSFIVSLSCLKTKYNSLG